MLSDCTERRSTIANGDQQVNVGNKKKIVVSLRSLVNINIDMLPEGNCALKSADIREEKDSRGRKLHRVYLKYGQYKIGWVLNGSTSKCLVCDVRFGTFLRRHHCRSCGIIMCHACSLTKDLVVDLDQKIKTRICDICVSERASVSEAPRPGPATGTAPVVVAAAGCVERDAIDTILTDTDIDTGISAHNDIPRNNESSIAEEVSNIVETPVSISSIRHAHDDNNGNGNGNNYDYDCEYNSADVSDVTDPHYGMHPTSTVSPSLVRKLAAIGFNGDNNSSDEDDETPLHHESESESECESEDSSVGVLENESFMSASGSSLGDESAQRYFLQSSDSNSSNSNSVSPLVCSISPIYKRQPVMRSPGRSSSRRSQLHPPTANLNSDLLQEKDTGRDQVAEQPRALNRRRSIGEIFGLKTKPRPATAKPDDGKKENEEERARIDSHSNSSNSNSSYGQGPADRSVSASGSSVGDASARRFFFGGSDASVCTSTASFNSSSPCGQDVVVHDTFHSPSFASPSSKAPRAASHTFRTTPPTTITSTASAATATPPPHSKQQLLKGAVVGPDDCDKENTSNLSQPGGGGRWVLGAKHSRA